MAIITSEAEITKLRQSGKIAATVLQSVAKLCQPGISTLELDQQAEKMIIDAGGQPSFKGYQGYPTSLCLSVNDQVVHGIPDKNNKLVNGDVLKLDVGVNYQGLYSDHAVTVTVGNVEPDANRLISDTRKALELGIKAARVDQHIGDVGYAVQNYLAPRGYGIVTQLTGHGLGYAVHEPPAIPNIGRRGQGPIIVSGMVLAIEPMVVLGSPEVYTADDNWTVITADHKIAAHFEHTVLVTQAGPEIITQV